MAAEAPAKNTIDDSTPKGRVQLELDEQLGALRYEIELQDQKKKSAPVLFKSESAVFDVQVKAGKYLLKARVLDARGVPGPWSATESVVVTPAITQNLEQPELLNRELSSPDQLQWNKKSEYLVDAQLEYQAYLANAWTVVEKIEKLDSDHWKLRSGSPAGQYRWTMKFVDEVYGESKPIQYTFVLKPTAQELRAVFAEIEKTN